jgi:3-deoxy-D-manno-octulosonic-acid transferase
MSIWSIVAHLLLPFALLNLIWRGIRYPAYWRRWPERFGYLEPMQGKRVIWVHAVSVGEVRSSAELVNALTEQYPRHKILVTTMTPTGSEQVQELFGGRVLHGPSGPGVRGYSGNRILAKPIQSLPGSKGATVPSQRSFVE